MKINEVEELLGVSKANIRFYEKQGLLNPERSANNYRDYSDADVQRLQEIVILRKLGVPVQDIGRILSGELPLQEAIRANIASLEAQIESLNGALRLSQRIQKEQLDKLDTPRYWEIVHQEEQSGGKFADIMSEYWNLTSPTFRKMFLLEEGEGPQKAVKRVVLVCLVFALGQVTIWQADNFWEMFFYKPMIFLAVFLLGLPIYLLSRKHPKAASVIITVLVSAMALFLLLVLLFLVVLFLNGIFHFWY